MEKTKNLPMWRKVLICVSALAIVACSIVLANIHNIGNDYDVYLYEWNNESRIGNISDIDVNGNRLGGDWLNIGGHYWCAQDFENAERNRDYGELIRLYTYRIDDSSSPYCGESAALRIYDISNKCRSLGVNRGAFYKQEYDKLATSNNFKWKETTAFPPFKAATTGAYMEIRFKSDTSTSIVRDYFVIFANGRVYVFKFSNDNYEHFNEKIAAMFHKRCLSIIKDIDFNSYRHWEKAYAKYKILSDRAEKQRIYIGMCLCVIISLFSMLFFFLAIRKNGSRNAMARYISWYMIASFIIYSCVFPVWSCCLVPEGDSGSGFLGLSYFSVVVVLAVMESFLAKRSHEDYDTYFLLPNWLQERLGYCNELCKRMVLIFWAYPLFFIVPLPVVGVFVMLLYILPVSLLLAIICSIVWIWNGRKRKDEHKEESGELQEKGGKPQLYCRYCGRLVDADSEYCKHCGKKL